MPSPRTEMPIVQQAESFCKSVEKLQIRVSLHNLASSTTITVSTSSIGRRTYCTANGQSIRILRSRDRSIIITTANCPIEALIDSGASIHILDKTTFARIKGTNPLITWQSSSNKVFAYASDAPLALTGKWTSEISTKYTVTAGTFYVAANSKGNLLSFKTATD